MPEPESEPAQDHASTSSSPSPVNRDSSFDAPEPSSSSSSSSATASSSGSSSQVHHQYDNHQHFRHHEIEQQHFGVAYRGNNFALFDDASSMVRDDTWSCVIVVLTFWFFVSMTLILGVYGSVTLRLGPYTSLLVQPNPIFVQSIKVEERDGSEQGPVLYGFYNTPSLDVVKTWSEDHNASVQSDSHKEWIYYLNAGSHISISYEVYSPSSSLFLIIAQGSEDLAQWLEDPTYPNTTLSWNVIHGSGEIQQDISTSSSYYVALGNLNSEAVKVHLNVRIRALLHNTSEAYYKCTFTNGQCSLNVLFPKGNSAVLTSPGPEEGTSIDEWYVRLSYGPRWITYILGIGGMTVLMLLAFNFLNKLQCSHEDEGIHYGQVEPERAPLLPNKDDDLSSWGSSYDSLSHDEEDFEELLAAGSLKDGENSNNTRRLCAICFDAPRDCFFLPCGHCVSCFECGTRIAEAAGTCPICRRNMKKVRKIFTV